LTRAMFNEMKKQCTESELNHPQGTAKKAPKTLAEDKLRARVKHAVEQRRCLEIPLDSNGTLKQQKNHFVFCMDESGSMGGSPWTQLNQAFRGVWNYFAQSQSSSEFCSVVQYACSARVTMRNTPFVGPAVELSQCSGGTCFNPAAIEAKRLVEEQKGCNTIIIFMSDGGTSDGPQAKSTLASISHSQVKVYTVAFGSGADSSVLQDLAGAKPGGRFFQALTGADLATTFSEIATSVTNDQVNELLYKNVAEQLAQRMTDKLVADCL